MRNLLVVCCLGLATGLWAAALPPSGLPSGTSPADLAYDRVPVHIWWAAHQSTPSVLRNLNQWKGLPSDEVMSAFLREIGPQLGIADPARQLKLISKRNSLTGTHYHYVQIVDGVPVDLSFLMVAIRFDGTIAKVENRFRPAAQVTTPSRTANGAQDLARTKIPLGAQVGELAAPMLVVLPVGEEFRTAWRVLLPLRNPPAELQIDVDASSGELLTLTNRYLYAVDGAGRAFRPSPVVTAGDWHPFTDNSNADTPELTAELRDVVLRQLNDASAGRYKIKGPFCDMRLTSGRVTSTTSTFNYTRSQPGFEEVNAYYAIDSMARYIHSLGFNDIHNDTIPVNAHAGEIENSWFSPGDGSLNFGDGGVDDAEDGEIISHEYCHFVANDIVSGFGSTDEGGAMGEGGSDFWAMTFWSFEPYGLPVIGDWDATFYSSDEPPALRRMDGTKHYPEDIDGEVHDDGEIWSRCWWDIWHVVGRPHADSLFLQSFFHMTPDVDFASGAEAVLETEREIWGDEYTSEVAQAFIDRGIIGLSIYMNHIPPPDPVIALHTPVDLNLTARIAETGAPVDSAVIYVRLGRSGGFARLPLARTGDTTFTFTTEQDSGVVLYYYFKAWAVGLNRLFPTTAPGTPDSLLFDQMDTIWYDDASTDKGWTLGAPGDDATEGQWVRVSPQVTLNVADTVQPGVDHTATSDNMCWVTGNRPGTTSPGASDIETGKTTMTSPIVDIRHYRDVMLCYARWYAQINSPLDDSMRVEISSNGGTTWRQLERVLGTSPHWMGKSYFLGSRINLTSSASFRVRFIASDYGHPSIVEAAVDDVLLLGIGPLSVPAERVVAQGELRLEPNPLRGEAWIVAPPGYRGRELEVRDVLGRPVAVLTLTGERTHWNTTTLDAGVYLLMDPSGGKIVVKAVIMR